MNYRTLGKTNWQVSEISFGAWAIGADWGDVSEDDAMRTLHQALDCGINFFDTADVYGDGRSERLIARLREERDEDFYVATKIGRRLNPHTSDGYNNRDNLTGFIDRSLKNLNTDALDLVQLHCPPTDVYYLPEVFGMLDDFVAQGKVKYYGVSVEKVEEGLKAMAYENVASVQIIFNMLRQRPIDLFFQQAQRQNVGVLARVPLASGLLTGKYDRDATFPANDHRNYNRKGEAFDVGETFAGVPFGVGVDAAERLAELLPDDWPADATMAQFALAWVLQHDAVTCAIPGGKNSQQVRDNVRASELSKLDDATIDAVREVYDELVYEHVHQRW